MELFNTKLGEICKIKGGYAFKSKDFKDSGVPVIKIANIHQDSVLVNDSTSYVDDSFLNKYNEFIINNGSILIALSGATTGKIGIYKSDTEALLNQRVAMIVPNESKVITKYIYFCLKALQKKIFDKALGAAQPNISTKELEGFDVLIGDVDYQNKIVRVLDSAQSLIDKRKAQILALSSLEQSTFLEMFGDPILNKKKWSVEKLGDICTVVRGGSPRPIEKYLGGTVPWIKIGDATTGDSIYLNNTKEKIKEEGIKKSRLVPSGSLIFANCGVSLGFARIITFEGCIHDGWLAFENISTKMNKVFLLKLLNFYTNYFRQTAPDGTQPNLNTSIMKEFGVIIPPIELQEKYVQIILRLEHQKSVFEQSLIQLEGNFQSLLQQAHKGNLFKV